jgi:hypothetical protein
VDDIEHLYLSERMGDLYEAWTMYQSTQVKANMRWEIEARLLARQTTAEIASKTGTRESIIAIYSQIFFDVQSRLESPGWITHVVIGDAFNRSVDKQPDGLWKLFGYWGGPFVLDSLIYRFNCPVWLESYKFVPGFIADDIRGQMQTKAMLAIRSMPVNWQTQIEIMNLYYRMMELENNTDAIAAGGAESFKSSIAAFMNSIPWTRDNKLKTNFDVIDTIDAGSVSLRSDELMLAGVGGTVEVDSLNIAYPEPNTKPAGG